MIASLRALTLAAQLTARWDVPADVAADHVAAAIAAESSTASAELLLAIAHRESNFDPLAGPRSNWPVTLAAPRSFPGGACGPMQVVVRRWADCVALRDLTTGYRRGAEVLAEHRAFCLAHGRRGRELTRCALAGYARGGATALRGDTVWSAQLLREEAALQGRAGKVAS